MVGRHVEEPGLRREGGRLLVFRTERGGANPLRVLILALGLGTVLLDDLGPAGLHVDMRGPIDLRVELLGHQQRAGLAVEGVPKTIAVEVDERLGRLAFHVDVGQDHLVDAVVIPFVMRRHLEDPFGDAGVGIAGKNGHRPFVVPRPLRRVPRAGVARAVINQVQLRVVGVPAPGIAAADLPLVALPGLQGRILADGLAELGGVGIEQDLIVGADRIGPPCLRSVLQIVGGDVPRDAELAAADADDDLVFDHHRGVGHRLALFRIAVFDAPNHLTGFGVERHDGGIGLLENDLAVAIGHTPVDRVAAHHRDDCRILLRFILPQDLAILVEVEREDVVGERCIDVHDVADNEGTSLVAAQNSRREGPQRTKILGVVFVDLVELAVTPVRIIASGHHPLVGVFRELDQLIIGTGAARNEGECRECEPES